MNANMTRPYPQRSLPAGAGSVDQRYAEIDCGRIQVQAWRGSSPGRKGY
ncbi:hypothetical protein AB0M10_15320 [Streptomyces sp. NPDC051840]